MRQLRPVLSGSVIVVLAVLLAPSVSAADLDFTLTAPKGWTQRTQSSALAHYKKGPGSFILTADVMPATANTPDGYVTFAKSQLSQVLKDVVYEPVVAGNTDGHDSRELRYVSVSSGMKLKYDVLYVFKGGKAYTLTGATMVDFFTPEFAADLKAFFDSFRFK